MLCPWLSVHENHRTHQTFPMAGPKCLMRDFTNLIRIYKAHRTNVWWIMKVFRELWWLDNQCLKLSQKSCRSSCLESQIINIKLKKRQQKAPGPPPKLSASDRRTCGNFQHCWQLNKSSVIKLGILYIWLFCIFLIQIWFYGFVECSSASNLDNVTSTLLYKLIVEVPMPN